MRNFRSNGESFAWTNGTGTAVTAGSAIVIGALLAIAVTDIANGAVGEVKVVGEYDLPATAADAWAQGAMLFWDAVTGKLSDVSGTIICGHATKAKLAQATTATVTLRQGAINVPDAASVSAAMMVAAVYPMSIDLARTRQAAAIKDALPDTPNATTLGLADAAGSAIVGTTTNGGATASASETCAFQVALPANYADGEAITLRVRAKVSALRQVSQSIDAVVKKVGDAALGADICATAAIALTNAYANHDFTITPTGLVAGDVLDVVITLATDDTGGNSNGLPSIAKIELRPTVRV